MPVYAREPKFYGEGLPSVPPGSTLPGRLIVIEGPDNVGRSTLMQMLHDEMEHRGHAVSSTGFRRSDLTRDGLEQARKGNTLGPRTMALFYATDFADRLERQIIPAMRAGFWVLSDRYFYSIGARDLARGADREWIQRLYGFALIPDLTIYLRASVDDLVPRVLAGRGFDYWESGMDLGLADNLYDSFRIYQQKLIDLFDGMVEPFNFQVVDASRPVESVYRDVRRLVLALEDDATPKETPDDRPGTRKRR